MFLFLQNMGGPLYNAGFQVEVMLGAAQFAGPNPLSSA